MPERMMDLFMFLRTVLLGEKIDGVTGVPNRTYVNALVASQHDDSRVYAAFNNHKNGDFKPYVFRSNDKGVSWVNIVGNLPKRGSVYAIAEDHVNPDLLFAGTEFGLFFTINGGKEWTQLKAGIPTIAIRDIAIQRRENDVVCASFGRGFYVLDDYSPLREMSKELKEKDAHIFEVKDALMYIESNPLGLREQGSQGESYYLAKNPEYGATFTYYVKEKPKTLKEQRQEKEKEIKKSKGDVFYPSFDEIRAESAEEKPFHLFIVRDENGMEMRKLKQDVKKGVNRLTWNYRYATTSPIKLKTKKPGRYSSADDGMMALPGNYTVELHRSVNGKLSQLVGPTPFTIRMLDNVSLPAADKTALLSFQKEVAELKRSINGTSSQMRETEKKLKYIKQAIIQYPGVPFEMMDQVNVLESQWKTLRISLWGDGEISKHQFETAKSISSMIGTIVYQSWWSSSAPTQTQLEQFAQAQTQYTPLRSSLTKMMEEVNALEQKLNALKVPYTPNRDNSWKEE